MEADAWATALMVMGTSEGSAMARRVGLDALFLDRDEGGLRQTPVGRLFAQPPPAALVQPERGESKRKMSGEGSDRFKIAVLIVALAGLVAGVGLRVAGRIDLAEMVWVAGVIPVLAALVVEIVRSLSRGEVGLDIVAALSMSAALVFGETLAAAVVALMYSGGTFLESFAEGRARREMRDLLSRVPRTATRHRDGALDEVPLDEIVPGDFS